MILAPILATKLFVPPPPPRTVARARLVERLDAGLAARRRVTLISAPAGFGKTTLAAAWLAGGATKTQGSARRAAWVSLDENDGDPIRFLTYLTCALQTAIPGFGAGILDSLQAPQPPPVEAVLTTLVNEIAAFGDTGGAGPVILVLDDYHAVDSSGVDAALTFLVEHLPQQLHFAITTREDPALPLPRLRARGQLTELRAADLRFTPTETAAFLNEVMDLGLTAQEVAALESRTEGWIAGLQLAALSMQGREDVTGFIQAFAGDHRYIVDYLVEEVLARQSAEVRSFLLQTAILERLHGPLCDAVTGRNDGQARLEALQRGNFFVVPLDDSRRWYRYHHLFAGVLRMHLLAERRDEIPTLHRHAGAWYSEQGMPDDAIRHALAGEDFEGAAGLIELAIPELRRTRQEATMLRWLRALPDEVLRHRPVLSLHFAGALLLNGEYDDAAARLRDAERLVDRATGAGRRQRRRDDRRGRSGISPGARLDRHVPSCDCPGARRCGGDGTLRGAGAHAPGRRRPSRTRRGGRSPGAGSVDKRGSCDGPPILCRVQGRLAAGWVCLRCAWVHDHTGQHLHGAGPALRCHAPL